MNPDDTIAAVATAPGPAAVAVVRVSGAAARQILERVFRRPAGRALRPRLVQYGHVVDPTSGERIDEALAYLLPAPHTYTREPIAEIHCHGGDVAPRRVLAALLRAGARMAEPGEFTLRAFLNGRIDLAQAEGVLDVIEARTEAAMRLGLQSIGGRLSDRVRAIRRQALALLADVTATVDFPDEVPPAELEVGLIALLAEMDVLVETAERGGIYRSGARVAIVGRPNVGKSSLLNALLGRTRAIVAPTPGTTRDTLEEWTSLDGVPVLLIDTAGLRPTLDEVEQIGVERARAAAAGADAVIVVIDASEPLGDADRRIVAETGRPPAAVVLNKSDLPLVLAPQEVSALPGVDGAAVVAASARSGLGLAELEAALGARLRGAGASSAMEAVAVNGRQAAALAEARGLVMSALEARNSVVGADAVASTLSAAVERLGSITGEESTEELLATVFSRFCIGK